MIYDLAPGQLIDSGTRVLDADEVEDARQKLAAGRSLENVAKALRSTVYAPPARAGRLGGRRHVAVDVDALRALVGDEAAADLADLSQLS